MVKTLVKEDESAKEKRKRTLKWIHAHNVRFTAQEILSLNDWESMFLICAYCNHWHTASVMRVPFPVILGCIFFSIFFFISDRLVCIDLISSSHASIISIEAWNILTRNTLMISCQNTNYLHAYVNTTSLYARVAPVTETTQVRYIAECVYSLLGQGGNIQGLTGSLFEKHTFDVFIAETVWKRRFVKKMYANDLKSIQNSHRHCCALLFYRRSSSPHKVLAISCWREAINTDC